MRRCEERSDDELGASNRFESRRLLQCHRYTVPTHAITRRSLNRLTFVITLSGMMIVGLRTFSAAYIRRISPASAEVGGGAGKGKEKKSKVRSVECEEYDEIFQMMKLKF